MPIPRRDFEYSRMYLTANPTDEDPWLTAYLAKLRTIEHDAMAWSFPTLARGMRYHQPNRRYPGVVMLATLGKIEPAADPAATA